MNTLKPIYDYDSYSNPIAQVIYSALYHDLFAPLLEIFAPSKENAKAGALVSAIRSGRLHYDGRFFSGALNVAITKELRGIGAVYNKTRKAYALETSSLPQDILIAIRDAQEAVKDQQRKVEEFLAKAKTQKMPKLDFSPFFNKTVDGLDKQFHITTKNVTGKDLEVPLADYLKKDLKEQYTDSLDLYIQGWRDEQITRLREKVTKNVAQGYRAESLVNVIQAEKGVTLAKAKFLAKQETSLMTSKYRELRYKDIGLDRYRWSTSHDGRVRKDHRHLQGKVFSYNEPPITNQATGARNNPGEDFGCRCVAIPVIELGKLVENEYARS